MENINKQEVAKLLYTNNHCTAKEIAEKLEITEEQIKTWIKTEGWSELQQVLFNSKHEQLRICYKQLTNLNKAILDGIGYPTADEAITQKRLASSIKLLETETSIGNTIMVAKEFTTWLLDDDEKLAKTIIISFDAFIKQKLKQK